MAGYISIITAIISFGITSLLGFILIPYLRKLKFGQTIKEIGPTWHKNKQGTPTMGGILFISGITIASLIGYTVIKASSIITDSRDEIKLIAGLALALSMGIIGFVDDYIKISKKRNLGLTARQKTIIQLLISIAYIIALQFSGDSTSVLFPFIGKVEFGIAYYPIMVICIYGLVNAVNLTDGVDGLASSVTFVVAVIFMVITSKLENPFVNILATATSAGCLGFLVWNFHPAKVFMGDTGSMFLGGAVVALGFGTNLPFLLILVGIIYIIEALSVVLQVISFKTTGKRIFKMSPIHHHFEMCGWSEVKIVAVFSFLTLIFGLVAVFFVLFNTI